MHPGSIDVTRPTTAEEERYTAGLSQALRRLDLPFLADNIDSTFRDAQAKRMSFSNFFTSLMVGEVRRRDEQALPRRLKQADFPDLGPLPNG